MIEIARKLLAPPVFEDEEQTRVASLLHLITLTLLVASIITAVSSLYFGHFKAARALAFGTAGTFGVIWLARRGYLKGACLSMLLMCLGIFTYLLYVGDGVHDIAALTYPVVLIMAALLLDRRTFIAYTLLVILSLQGIIYGELNGFIVDTSTRSTLYADSVSASVILVITAVSAHLLADNIADSIDRVRSSRCALAASNRKLQREFAERVQAEEALRKSEEKYRTLVTQSPDGIFIIDMQGAFLSVNKAMCDGLGYSEKELLSMKLWDIVPQEYQALHRDRLASIKTGEISHQAAEYVVKGKDGKARFVEVRSSPHYVEGEIGGFQGTARDITERVQATQELSRLMEQVRAQAQQMEHLVEAVPEGVVLLNANRRVILANRTAEKNLTVLGDAQVGDILTRLGDRSIEGLLTSPPTGLWHEVSTNAPAPRIFEAIARPIETGPALDQWVLVFRDVTQERALYHHIQQQERLAAVGQLAAGIAHDFNNILGVIVLYTKLALNTPELPPMLQGRLETVSQQAWRATELIQQVLDFSRQSVLERGPLDLAALLKETVKLLERTLPENITIDLTYDEQNAPFTVNADPTRLQQAFMNLAINARDAMLSKGGGKLRLELDRITVEDLGKARPPEMALRRVQDKALGQTLRAHPAAQWSQLHSAHAQVRQHKKAGEWVRLSVSDDGMGIPPDVLTHIFEPFFTTKQPGAGTGLGLAQVWGIVQQHEGYIDVTTQTEAGTKFTLYLPALKVTQPTILSGEVETFTQGRGETVLVVEDNTAMREALVDGLESANYRVLAAANGREAVETFRQCEAKVAFVLTDRVMPEMGGVALLHALRKEGWRGKAILMSGHPSLEDDEHLKLEGLVRQLRKPVDLEELAQVIAQCLEGVVGCEIEQK